MDPTQAELIQASGLPLEGRTETTIKSLSGGQRQGAAIVLALSQQRQLLLLDEFTSALDDAARSACMDLISAEAVRRGLTILAVMHNVSANHLPAARMVTMQAGRIREQ